MKLSSILAAALMTASATASGAGLAPFQYSVGQRPMTAPLQEISVDFHTEVETGDVVSAWLAVDRGDGQLDLACLPESVDVSNYVGSKATQGTVIFNFTKQNLPLGQTYVFGIDAGSIRAKDDPSLTNDELRVSFEVPADLGPAHFDLNGHDLEHDPKIAEAERIWCYWGIETEPVGEPEFILYRESQEIGRYPAHVGWDWDLGQAYVDFGEEMKFDRGVGYSLVLPAGSVHGMWRDDLLNPEARLDFTGDYDPSEEPLQYTCTVEVKGPGLLHMVRFHFTSCPWPIPAQGAKAQLYHLDSGTVVAEADLVLNTSVNHIEIDADFGGFSLPEGHSSIVIPDGALLIMTEDGTRPCRGISYSMDGAGVSGIVDDDAESGVLYDLRGIRVDRPRSGEIYIRDGKKTVWR